MRHNTYMQNTHLEHPEDTILTGDMSVLDCLMSEGDLSVKIDGAPAIVWGTNPTTGNFFVGTKSVFNKVKIKINESHQDIEQNHTGAVAEILHHCFDCLPSTSGIIQCDFIGFGGDDNYTPNTITYLFDEIIHQNIIIAPHTLYATDGELKDAYVINDMVDMEIFEDTETCKFVQPKARIFSGSYDKCAGSFDDLSDIIDFARQMSTMVQFVDEKKAKKIKQQINACIRTNVEVNADDFDCDPNLIGFWKLVKSIKDDALYLCRNNGPAAYIGQDRIDAEGYVFTNQFGMIKLINREQFSYANFNCRKFQSAV